MNFDSLWHWRAALASLLVALAWAGLLRLLGRGFGSGLGLAAGLAVGWTVLLGLALASPRQLAERLPILALAGLLLGLLLEAPGRRRGWLVVLLGVPALAACGWWLAGAPLHLPDARRIAVTAVAVALAGGGVALELRSPGRGLIAAVALLAGTWLAAPPGPWLALAICLAAAALGAMAGGMALGPAARLATAPGFAALAAAPVIQRGSVADWLAAAAPLSALWAGPALAGQIGGRFGQLLGPLLAGALPLAILLLIRAL